jgi:hypothetical protein
MSTRVEPPTRRRPLRSTLAWALVVVALATLVYSVYAERRTALLAAGDPSPRSYVAPVDLLVPDRVATERERQAAMEQVSTIYSVDPTLQRVVLGSLAGIGLPEATLDVLAARYYAPSGVRAEDLAGVISEAAAAAPPERQREVRLLLERRLVATATPNDRLTEAARAGAAAAVPLCL